MVGVRPVWLKELVARFGLAPPAHFDPPMGFDRDPGAFAETVVLSSRRIRRAFAFLAVGSPLCRSVWPKRSPRAGWRRGTGLCIGASLAFLAGAERRAPVWMQRSGLEWAYRLGTDPRRLARRYLVDSPHVVSMLLRERGLAP